MPELMQDRVFGAVRFLDGTTLLKVNGNLNVQAPNVLVRRNRSNLYVIWDAPANGAVVFTVNDPSSNYLSRRFTVTLPRDLDPAHASQASSIFQPQDVLLLPSPMAPASPGWAIIRARVKKAGVDTVLAGALIRVTDTSDQTLLARGMSDARGEALVLVPGVPVTTFDSGAGAVMATEIDVSIQTVFDPALSGIPDPDDLDARKGALTSSTIAAKLAASRVLVTELNVTIA
jgi:hypothetical protein